MINVSYVDLGKEEKDAAISVIDSKMLAQGRKVNEFEEKFANYVGTKFAIATSSGTTALQVALLSNGIGSGDEVITTPFSFIASSNSILSTGAKPVFVDINYGDYNLDTNKLKDKIGENTRAILPVHLFGNPCNLDNLIQLSENNDLKLIEDSCQAHGAEYFGKKVGSFGTGTFSFYPTKNMFAGEGGMITTNDEEVANKAKLIRNHGQEWIGEYRHVVLGYNYRMTDIAASIGIVQLEKLDSINKKRINNANYFNKNIENNEEIILPFTEKNTNHVFHQYTMRVLNGKRDLLKDSLENKGIQSRIFYPLPINQQPLYEELGYSKNTPISEIASNEVLCLPVHPKLSNLDLEKIVESVNGVIKKW